MKHYGDCSTFAFEVAGANHAWLKQELLLKHRRTVIAHVCLLSQTMGVWTCERMDVRLLSQRM